MPGKPTKAQLAQAYAKRGWKIFPITPGTKDRPLVKWGSEASSDQAIVTQWWKRVPDANIGLAVGQSGLAIIDLDNKPSKVKGQPAKNGSLRWAELEMLHGEAPPTLTSRTPSGGFHMIFRGGVRNSVDRLAPGVDTRGEGGMGGYILLPGSELPNGRYEWEDQQLHPSGTRDIADLPGWVVQAIGDRKAERKQREDAVVELDQPSAIQWAQTYLSEDAKPAVSGQGGNNRAFYTACSLRDKGLSEETAAQMMIDLYNERCEPPWSDEEIRTFAKNAYEYGSVVPPGGDSAQAHFGSKGKGEKDFGRAGPPPDISMFAEFGARPLAARQPADDEKSGEGGANPPGPDKGERKSRSFTEDWAWIAQQKVFIRRKDKFLLDAVSFDSLYGYLGEKGKVTPTIFQSKSVMQKFDTMQFLPGGPEFAGAYYNTWTRPRIRPAEGDTSPFDDHMERLLPDERERAAALDWMAWVVQNETLKPNFMFLMQGEQGCGKSWLGVLMSRLVDENNTTFLRTEDVGNRFNSWILKTRLAVVEELMGDDKRALANRMKALITQDTVTVEMKGKDLITMPNKAAFMAFTNHLDALRLENSDRRYMVFRTKAKGLGTPQEYLDRLWSFCGGDGSTDVGPAAVLHKLLTREVPVKFGLGRAPHTKAHDEMRREGLPELERWMTEEHELGNPPFSNDLICVTDVEAMLPDRLKRMNGLHKLIPAFLRDELNAKQLGAHRLGKTGRQAKLWAIRRGELYEQMSPSKRVERYLNQTFDSAPGSSVGDDFNDVVDGTPDDLGDPMA